MKVTADWVSSYFLHKFTPSQYNVLTTTPTVEGQGLLTEVTNLAQKVHRHDLAISLRAPPSNAIAWEVST